jgi:murein DD-endopeptidase MepM/ murein hydrolase activator NlpD
MRDAVARGGVQFSSIHTRYGHLQAISVELGDEIGYRQELGKLGSSGRRSGPHVSCDMRVNGNV